MNKQTFPSIITYSFILLFAAGLLLFPKETAESVKVSLSLCGQTIIPCLFPFMFISKLLIKLKKRTGNNQGIMRKVFTLNDTFSSALALGFIGGYPIGASIISDLYTERKCTKQEAERALAFCNNCGPSFIIGVVGAGFFSSVKTGVFLYIIHITSALIIGCILRFISPLQEHIIKANTTPTSNKITKNITEAVVLSINSILTISAYIILFSVFVCILKHYGIIKKISILFSILTSSNIPFIEPLLAGIMEITVGLSSLNNCTDYSTAMILSSFLIGWGGLSVHMQSLSCISETDLKTGSYILFKFIHGIIAGILTYALLPFFNNF